MCLPGDLESFGGKRVSLDSGDIVSLEFWREMIRFMMCTERSRTYDYDVVCLCRFDSKRVGLTGRCFW